MPIFMYFTRQGFLCRPLNATASEDVGIEPRTATELAITATFIKCIVPVVILKAGILELLSFPPVVRLKSTRSEKLHANKLQYEMWLRSE